MPSTKGKPTNQKLHDDITEKIKQETNKDGSGQFYASSSTSSPNRDMGTYVQNLADFVCSKVRVKWQHGVRLPAYLASASSARSNLHLDWEGASAKTALTFAIALHRVRKDS